MIEVYGIKELMADIRAAGDIPPNVLQQMVQEQSKLTEEALIYNAGSMLKGKYYQGDVAASVKAGKPRVTRQGATVKIEFKGMAHGNRVAEIAFINEYGKTKQEPRPFIKKSINDTNEPAAQAAKVVLDAWLASKHL